MSYSYDSSVNPSRNDYERGLREHQKRHLESVHRGGWPWQPCLHDSCPECVGTGIKRDGTACVHSLSCPCPKCNPTML